jgi:excisionase family DNA binding protein
MKEIEGIKFFTIQEVASKLDITSQTIRKYIKQDKLKAQKIGRAFLVSEKSLFEFLNV